MVKGKEAAFAMVLMTADPLMRKGYLEGLYANLYPLPYSNPQNSNSQDRKTLIKLLKL